MFYPTEDDVRGLGAFMQTWVLQQDGFNGNVKLSSQPCHSFYRYSLWRAGTGEHLFDGAAGDPVEALDAMRAHVSYLSAGRVAAGE
jgi:hypothetical protein